MGLALQVDTCLGRFGRARSGGRLPNRPVSDRLQSASLTKKARARAWLERFSRESSPQRASNPVAARRVSHKNRNAATMRCNTQKDQAPSSRRLVLSWSENSLERWEAQPDSYPPPARTAPLRSMAPLLRGNAALEKLSDSRQRRGPDERS